MLDVRSHKTLYNLLYVNGLAEKDKNKYCQRYKKVSFLSKKIYAVQNGSHLNKRLEINWRNYSKTIRVCMCVYIPSNVIIPFG